MTRRYPHVLGVDVAGVIETIRESMIRFLNKIAGEI
jgi:hypothetical protein